LRRAYGLAILKAREIVYALVPPLGFTVSVKTAPTPSSMLVVLPWGVNLRFALPPSGTAMFKFDDELNVGPFATSKAAPVIVTSAAPTLRTVTYTALQLVPEHRA